MDESAKMQFRCDIENFFSHTCLLASASRDLEVFDPRYEREDHTRVSFVEEILERGLRLVRTEPKGFPKSKFAAGIVRALADLKRVWSPWLQTNSMTHIPDSARLEIIHAQLEVCRQFVSMESELRTFGFENGVDLSEFQLDEAARQRIRDEGKELEVVGIPGDNGNTVAMRTSEVTLDTSMGFDDTYLAHTEIARMHDVDAESLRKRLERFRGSNMDDWHEVQNPRRNEPKYLYRYEVAKKIALALKASGGSSAERPPK